MGRCYILSTSRRPFLVLLLSFLHPNPLLSFPFYFPSFLPLSLPPFPPFDLSYFAPVFPFLSSYFLPFPPPWLPCAPSFPSTNPSFLLSFFFFLPPFSLVPSRLPFTHFLLPRLISLLSFLYFLPPFSLFPTWLPFTSSFPSTNPSFPSFLSFS